MNGEKEAITVFIIAASLIVRAGLESVLQNDASIVITGGAAEISRAPLDFQNAQTPEVLLINVEREKDFEDLIEFLSETAESDEIGFPFVLALLAPQVQTRANLLNALQNNLRGALPHDASRDEISQAIKTVARNLNVLSPNFVEKISSHSLASISNLIVEDQSENELVESLTTREREVLELLVEGESNKRIANLLDISEHTVKFHVASVFGKLGANTRTEAAMIALRRGLILL